MIFAVVAAVLTVGTAAAPSVATPRQAGVVDVDALRVSYHGQELTAPQARNLQETKEAAHQEFVIVYDRSSATAGIAHAFDTRSAADSYGQQLRTATYAPAVVPMTGCPDAKNISRMYDLANCGGAYFAFALTESDSTFDPYGWNNRGTSLVVGHATSGCQVLIRLYPGTNYTYTEARFYGDTVSTYYLFNSAQNNNFESGKSTCS